MDRLPLIVLGTLATIVILFTWGCHPSRSEPALPQCQTPSPCKVLMLSKEEEEALVGPNRVLDTAVQGRPLDLASIVNYFRDKIRTAPAGSPMVQPEAPKP